MTLLRLFVIDIAASAVPLHSAVAATGLTVEASVASPFAIDLSVAANPKVAVTVRVVIESETSFAVVLAATAIVDLDLVTSWNYSAAFVVVQELLVVASYG